MTPRPSRPTLIPLVLPVRHGAATSMALLDTTGPVAQVPQVMWRCVLTGKAKSVIQSVVTMGHHRCWIKIGSGKVWGHVNTLSFVSCFFGSFWAVCAAMHRALSCWGTYSQMQMVLVMSHLHKSGSRVSQQHCTVARWSMLDYQWC